MSTEITNSDASDASAMPEHQQEHLTDSAIAAGRTPKASAHTEELEDEDEDEEGNFYNPNRMPKKTGNLNARNLIGIKKESGKGARNDRREAISGSDSDANDELAHI